MTSQSINSIESLLELITSNSKEYYIEQKSIASKEQLDGHTIYSRFKKFRGELTPTLLKQHLYKDINLAITLDNCNAMVFEYTGKHQEAFVSTLKYFFSNINDAKLYLTTVNSLKIVVYVIVNFENCVEFRDFQKKLLKKLDERLIADFKILPTFNRPKLANLLILPREFIIFN